MEQRYFPGIKGRPSLLGLGLMRLPQTSSEAGDIDYDLGMQMVEYALASGINYFDTAYIYHDYMSELFVGEVLSSFPRESFLLADKLPVFSIESIEQAKEIFSEQLDKCRVDYFDFYFLHSLDRQTIKRTIDLGLYDLLADYKRQGLIRNLCYSIHDTPDILENFTRQYGFDAIMIQLNYVDWELQNAQRSYEFLLSQAIPVLVMEPVRGGALANLPVNCSEKLKALDSKASQASWALRFAASLPGVMTILSGMSNLEQLKDNISTLSKDYLLSEEEISVLTQIRKLYLAAGRIPCTDCLYCLPCPFGVGIPEVFSLYNQYLDSDNRARFCQAYQKLSSRQPAACTDCAVCEDKCPQKIEIRAELKKIRSFYEHINAPDQNR